MMVHQRSARSFASDFPIPTFKTQKFFGSSPNFYAALKFFDLVIQFLHGIQAQKELFNSSNAHKQELVKKQITELACQVQIKFLDAQEELDNSVQPMDNQCNEWYATMIVPMCTSANWYWNNSF